MTDLILDAPGARAESASFPGKPPRWRKGLSLKIEIALAFGVVIALMLAMGVVFYFSEQRSAAAIDKLLRSDGRMADLSLRSALAMQKARAAEGEFLLSMYRVAAGQGHERSVLPIQSHLLDMREYLVSIRILASDPEFRDRIGQIEVQAQRYEDGFVAFVSRYEQYGHFDEPLQQEYGAAAPAVESLLEELHTTATKRALLTRGGAASAAEVTRWAVLFALAITTVLGAAVATVVSRRITGSVTQLIAFCGRVASGDFSAQAQERREHEFAVLARAMNQMARSLEYSQAQLLGAARVAGMAEIATNVLHNVGNVLNSVNISAGVVISRLKDSKAKGLVRAVALMDEHAQDLGAFLMRDTKGRLLPAYLRGLSQSLQVEQTGMAEELAQLSKSVDHIKDIVATQQSYAGASSLLEPVQLAELIEDALRMNAGSLTRHGVEVVRHLGELPKVCVDRHRLLQILINLLSNATHALDAAPAGNPVITIRVDDLEGRRVGISVSDNGEGIASENLVRIFAHGFTTRKTGHGFGLHSCVVATQEMGGSLSAHSDGPGTGATFVLELPVAGAALV